MNRVQFLFYFSSEDLCVLETKRLDLPSQTSMSDIYKWLIYFKSSRKFVPLSFRSMIKEDTCEFRSFAEAELKFDLTAAELVYQNKVFHLVKENPDLMPQDVKEDVLKYLFSLG
jgi:hypothetical protein